MAINMKKYFLISIFLFLFSGQGCTQDDSQPPALRLVVYTTKETRYDIVSLVERFALSEKLYQVKNYKIPSTDEIPVSISFIDEPQKIAWIWISNGNLQNKNHVEVSIFDISGLNSCDICKRFEKSAEMKEIQDKFETSEIVRNGDWHLK